MFCSVSNKAVPNAGVLEVPVEINAWVTGFEKLQTEREAHAHNIEVTVIELIAFGGNWKSHQERTVVS